MANIVNNAGLGISEMVVPPNTNDVTPANQIRDGLDFPHSGIFKTLYEAARGNYALKNGDTGSLGFNITFSNGTSPRIAVAAGKVFRDGKYVSVNAITASSDTQLSRPTSGHYYHLVVVAANNTIVVRDITDGSSATDDIPELTAGDIPIALIKVAHDANVATASLPTQFFTSNKTDNNLSVGYLDEMQSLQKYY